MRPVPVQRPRPPVWVGGNSARALRRAAASATAGCRCPTRARSATVAALHISRTSTISGACSNGLDDERAAADRDGTGLAGRRSSFDVLAYPMVPFIPGSAGFSSDGLVEHANELSGLGVTGFIVGMPSPSRTAYEDGARGLRSSDTASAARDPTRREVMDVREALYTTRAMRRVTSEPIPLDAQARILDAAVRAPSGGNSQNWRFLLVDSPEVKAAIAPIYKQAIDGLWTGYYKDRIDAAHADPEIAGVQVDARGAEVGAVAGRSLRAGAALPVRVQHRPRWQLDLPGDVERRSSPPGPRASARRSRRRWRSTTTRPS